jgi:hypothetical protein
MPRNRKLVLTMTYTPYQPPKRPRKTAKIVLSIVGGVIALIVIAGIAGGGNTSRPAPSGQVVSLTSGDPGSPPPAVPTVPAASDFTLQVVITSQQCFGTVGCDLTWKITPTLTPAALTGTWEVTYTIAGITGGDIESVDFVDGQYTPALTAGFGQTSAHVVSLTATVTAVTAG